MFFRVEGAEGYECVLPLRTDHATAFGSLDGVPRLASWAPVEVFRCGDEKNQPGRPADFPWCSGHLVMRRSALDGVGDLLMRSGEVLPLKDSSGVDLWIFNARIVPALDEQRSEVWRFKDGRIMYAKSPVLIESVTEGLDVFRIHLGSALFVSRHFVDRVREYRLSGLRFEEVPTTPVT